MKSMMYTLNFDSQTSEQCLCSGETLLSVPAKVTLWETSKVGMTTCQGIVIMSFLS